MGEEILLTPTALAKHWKRVHEESSKPVRGVNLSAPALECETCGGDRFVVVATRKPTQSAWMTAHSIKASETAMIEEMAPCYSCATDVEVAFWRFDGTRFTAPDPAQVRELHTR